MKKFLLIILILAAIAAAAVLLMPGEAQHEFSTEWTNDANNHWHACLDEGCTEKSDEAAHSFGEGK